MRLTLVIALMFVSMTAFCQDATLSKPEDDILTEIKKLDVLGRAGEKSDTQRFDALVNKFIKQFTLNSAQWTKEDFRNRCVQAVALRTQFTLASVLSQRLLVNLRPRFFEIARSAETMDQFVAVLAYFQKEQKSTHLTFMPDGNWETSWQAINGVEYYPINLASFLCQEIVAKRHYVDKFVNGGDRLLEKLEAAGIDKKITAAVRKIVSDAKELSK